MMMDHRPRRSSSIARGVAGYLLSAAGALGTLVGCNAVLGIEEATLCSSGCDAGVGGAAPTQPVTSAGNGVAGRGSTSPDAGTDDAARPVVTDELGAEGVVPGQTPTDQGENNSGPGNSGSNSGGSNSGSEGEDGDPPDGDGDSSGPGDGEDEGEPVAPPPEPEPPPPPPSPCDGRTAGEAFCDGATRILCGAGASVTSVSPCASVPHCEQATGGACAACLTGEARCEGASLLTCNAAHTGFDTQSCASPAQCNAPLSRCEAPVCAPNQSTCAGSVLQVCNVSLTGFDPVVDCGLPAACNAGAGACNVCTPGAARCIDVLTLSVCEPSGQGESLVSCGTLEICVTGQCVAIGSPF